MAMVQFYYRKKERRTDMIANGTLFTLPQLTFDHIDTIKIGEGTYKIEAHIANKGYLPTYLTDETKKMKIVSPVKVELMEEKTKAVSPTEIDLGNLEGFSGVATDYNASYQAYKFPRHP